MKITLRDWQKKALFKWQDNDYKGTIKAATGTGKTIMGIAGLKLFNDKPSVLIVVNTVHLQLQWKEELIRFGCPEELIGLVGNGKHEWDKKYVIGIVNSVRNVPHGKDLLLLDESHHYVSEHNYKVLKREFKYILCLSATPERADQKHIYLFNIAPIVYEYNVQHGIEDNVLSKYNLVNSPVKLTIEEATIVEHHSIIIQDGFASFGSFNDIRAACYKGNKDAAEVLKSIQARKKILLHCKNKPAKAVEIVKKESIHGIPKTIIFCEYIDTAEEIKSLLDDEGISSGLYHSKLKIKERRQFLEDYKDGKYQVMVTVKCLDEGVDVPETKLGIIVGGSSVKRQMIQRLGRLLRQKDGEVAKLYQLYVPGTKDADWMKKRSTHLQAHACSVIYE